MRRLLYAISVVAVMTAAALPSKADPLAGVQENRIADAFDGFDGVTTIQQNTGDDARLVVTGIVAPDGGLPAAPLSSAVLGATVAGTASVRSVMSVSGSGRRSNTISNAFNNARGIVVIQQNNGASSVLQSAVTVSGRY